MWKKFWYDEAGFVVTVELTLVASLLVIGLTAGLSTLRDSVTNELKDTAKAFGAVSPGSAAQPGSMVGTTDDGVQPVPTVNSLIDAADGIQVKVQPIQIEEPNEARRYAGPIGPV